MHTEGKTFFQLCCVNKMEINKSQDTVECPGSSIITFYYNLRVPLSSS